MRQGPTGGHAANDDEIAMDEQYEIKRAARLCHCVLSAKKHNDAGHYIHRIGGWTDEALADLENNLYQISKTIFLPNEASPSLEAARALLAHIDEHYHRLTAETFGPEAEQAKQLIQDLRAALCKLDIDK